jgi:SAM-dependent MidA family methyltransferase
MSATRQDTPLSGLLATRIRERGPITFAEYMRECLYHPEFGYYSRAETRRFGDYYTSVDVHPIFGRLLARQLAEMWELLGRPAECTLVEAGAGVGRLAKHILDFAARQLPEFYSAVRYVAVEQSPARRAAQAENIGTHIDAGHAVTAESLPTQIPAGCIVSNELVDALPVYRVVREHGELREIYVDIGAGGFCDVARPLSTPALTEYLASQEIALAEGQQAEIGLDACAWIEDAGKRLGRGFVCTVDYGHEARELFNELHMRGTLLAYQEHRAGEDYYRAPGEQDLTAHVNFTALERWGRHSGLERTGLVSQARFLMALGRANEFADLYDEGQSEVEQLRARLLLKTLIFPEGMGERFQVFIQHKGIDAPRLTGLKPF